MSEDIRAAAARLSEDHRLYFETSRDQREQDILTVARFALAAQPDAARLAKTWATRWKEVARRNRRRWRAKLAHWKQAERERNEEMGRAIAATERRRAAEAEVERLRAALERPIRENIHEATCRCVWDGAGDGCSCWLREARAALASHPRRLSAGPPNSTTNVQIAAQIARELARAALAPAPTAPAEQVGREGE